MKLFLWIMLASSVWAQPVLNTLPDSSCRLVTLGSRVVVQDARGFFMGYYQPAPPPAPSFTPSPKATASHLNSDTYFCDSEGRRILQTTSPLWTLPKLKLPRDAYCCDSSGRRNPYAEAGCGPDW